MTKKMAYKTVDRDLLEPLLSSVACLLAAERSLHQPADSGEPIAIRYIYLGLWASTTSENFKKLCERYPDLRPVVDVELPPPSVVWEEKGSDGETQAE